MISMQTKILERIESEITERGLEVSTTTGWANQVTVFVMRGLDTLVTFEFDFQREYLTGDMRGPLLTTWRPEETQEKDETNGLIWSRQQARSGRWETKPDAAKIFMTNYNTPKLSLLISRLCEILDLAKVAAT